MVKDCLIEGTREGAPRCERLGHESQKQSKTRHADVYHHKSTPNAMWSRIAILVTHTSNIGD
jgi:hypothetical protein